MAVPLPIDFAGAVLGLLPLIILGVAAVAGLLVSPALIVRLRQTGYERAIADERVRLEVRPPAGTDLSAEALVTVIRGLHPRHRRGVDAFRVGWPTIELGIAAADGLLAWTVEMPRMLVPAVSLAFQTAIEDVQLVEVPLEWAPASATALGRLTTSTAWPLAASDDPASGVTARLAASLATLPRGAVVQYRLVLRPLRPEAWRAVIEPEAQSGSVAGFVGRTVVGALLLHPTAESSAVPASLTLMPAEREAATRKRSGVVGFAAGIAIEVAGLSADGATVLLHRLTPALDVAGTSHQSIDWRIRRGAVDLTPTGALADWEVAALWSPPVAGFDRTVRRERPLAAPAEPASGTGLVIARNGSQPVSLAPDVLMRHLAVIGATGSGKSTVLLNLMLEAIRNDIGATIVDPHGDLVDDVLARIPDDAASRVAVLRLADRAHPRGFNILERRTPDEAQLVTSEFVDMLEDLWPRFCGPKMQHYLRHGLLTLLSSGETATVIELVRILTDDAFREPYVRDLRDPLLRAFWANEWPGPRERERDASIKAVLNKLGAFVAYEQIRNVVGQGTSTIRPRTIMDEGKVLLVDLSRVGGDNASLFGAMLISRYYIDAVGRQGTPLATRRPHLLVIDEAQRFDTRALGRLQVEGRKFFLGEVLASQSLAALGERLRGTTLTNAASLALLSPGQEDVRLVGPLFASVSRERLQGLRRFELVLRTPGADGNPVIVGGLVSRPEGHDPERITRITAGSDRRDARRLKTVHREVHERSSGTRLNPARPHLGRDAMTERLHEPVGPVSPSSPDSSPESSHRHSSPRVTRRPRSPHGSGDRREGRTP